MNLQKFLPLEKMEEQSDGTLHVFGIVTAEQPDLENEVCDYETTKAYYQKRADENFKKTSIPGMTPSVMPFREMHQLKVQGAGRDVRYDDANKIIRMEFHVVDAEAVKMWKAGAFVGFSQGGMYVKQWPDPDHKGCTRYTADPMEVSAVDSPCLPIALVEYMKGRVVTMTKSGGASEEVKLDMTDAGSYWRFAKSIGPIVESAVKAAFEKREFSDKEREHAASTGAALPDGSFPIENEQDLRNAIQAYGRAKDKEKAKAHIESRARALGLTHLLPEDWAGSSKAATGGEESEMKITDQDGLTKAAKSIHSHLEALKAAHEKMGEQHEKLGEHIDKCMKACKDAIGGEEPEKAAVTEVQKSESEKALEAKVEALTKSLSELTEKLAKTPAAVQAATGVVDPVRQADPDPADNLFKSGKVQPLQ